MTRIQLDETQQDVYHHNVVAALEAVYDAVEERAYEKEDATFHNVLNIHPPDLDDVVLNRFRTYAADTEDYDVRMLAKSWIDAERDTLFLDGVMDQIDAVSEEYDQLLTHYHPVELSTDTGLPVYSPSVVHDFRKDYASAIRDLRRDSQNTLEQLEGVHEALHDYVEEQSWSDEVDLSSLDTDGDTDTDGVNELFERVTDDIVSVAQQDILSGNLPEESWRQLERVERLEDLEEFNPFDRGGTDLTVIDSYDKSVFFRIDQMDYSDAKDNSPLFYGVAGQQHDTRSWLSRRSWKNLPIHKQDDEYSITPDVASTMDTLFDLPPESGLTLMDNLSEQDVPYGDTVHPTVIEMTRIGPFYFGGMDLPPTADEALEKATKASPDLIRQKGGDLEDFRYESLDEMEELNPSAYTAVQLRNFLDDKPEAYVLTTERYRASRGLALDAQFWQDRELFLAVPQETDLGDYLPEDRATDTGSFTTTVVPVPDSEPFDTSVYEAEAVRVPRTDTVPPDSKDTTDEVME